MLLEVPAIIVGVMLARRNQAAGQWGRLLHEVFMGKSIVLLVGGLLIGWVAGPVGIQPLEPLFFDTLMKFLLNVLVKFYLAHLPNTSRNLHLYNQYT